MRAGIRSVCVGLCVSVLSVCVCVCVYVGVLVCVTLWPIRYDDRSINLELGWIRVQLAECDAKIIA